MPRVLVTTNGPSPQTLLEKSVRPELTDHAAEDLIAALAQGIADAARAEAAFIDAVRPRRYTQVAAG